MKIKHVFVAALTLGLLTVSCTSDDNGDGTALGAYDNGILISNEGPFGNGTGTVSFISNDLAVEEAAIFNKVNKEDLGNIVQSIGFSGDEAFIIANNSQKITVVNRYTFEKIGAITTGLNNPRYFIEVNGTGYVTNWGDTADVTDDYVAIVNLNTYTVEGTISVVLGPEQLLAKDNTIYVAHKGAFGQNNKVSVIESSSNEVSKVITVGDVPDSMQLDATGNLWVLAKGKPSFSGTETAGALSKINTTTNEVISNFDFPLVTDHPKHLNILDNSLYYSLGASVYTLPITATTLNAEEVLTGISSYTMQVSNGRLYSTDAKDFASNGTLYIYDLGTKEEINSFTVGIIPGGIYFN